MTRYLPGLEPQRPVSEAHDGEGDDWFTPPRVLAAVASLAPDGMIDLDPCWSAGSLVEARHVIDVRAGGDGLLDAWKGDGLVWCNPPYSDVAPWLRRCRDTARTGRPVVALVPVSVETVAWWSDVWGAGAALVITLGRLRFVGVDGQQHGSAKSATCWIAWDVEIARRLARALRCEGFEVRVITSEDCNA